MRRMRRLFVLFVTAGSLLCLCACGSSDTQKAQELVTQYENRFDGSIEKLSVSEPISYGMYAALIEADITAGATVSRTNEAGTEEDTLYLFIQDSAEADLDDGNPLTLLEFTGPLSLSGEEGETYGRYIAEDPNTGNRLLCSFEGQHLNIAVLEAATDGASFAGGCYDRMDLFNN